MTEGVILPTPAAPAPAPAPQKRGFWGNVGLVLANVAKYAAMGALWASQHPEVVERVATIAGHPEVAAVMATAAPVAQAVGGAIQAAVDKKANG